METKQVLALGFFDGVHMGHQALLSSCRLLADELGVQAGALTFSVHPDALVMGKAPQLICTERDRDRLLRQYGMDAVTVLPFDEKMKNTPWREFFRLLITQFHAAGLVCGHDFRFGAGGEGNAQLLQCACREAGIPCIVVPEQKIDGITVSSTVIRQMIAAGEMEKAVRFLGHPYVLTGEVVSGRHIGRTIGIPTANLLLPDGIAVPAFGVYACRTKLDGREYMAVTNVGRRPTVGGHRITVESWLLDFAGDLYGKRLSLRFFAFVRPEKRFESLEDLRTEIQKNALQVRKFFEK